MKSRWTSWTNEQNTDRLIDGEQADRSGGWGLDSGGLEQKGNRTHGHGQQCGDCGERGA